MSLFINGQWIEGQGDAFVSSTPCETDTVWSGRAANSDQVSAAISAARIAAAMWRMTLLSNALH